MSETPISPTPKALASVRKAREALKEQAEEILAEYRRMIALAATAGEWEAALKSQQWLIDHLPSEDGQRLLDPSSDKPAPIVEGQKGPLIQIGVKIGGVAPSSPELPPAVTVEALEP